jgi:hypothetical protein
MTQFAPGLIYLTLGLSVDWSNIYGNGAIFTMWWIVALFEMFIILAHSAVSETMTFEGTHIAERINLLTLIVIGEGGQAIQDLPLPQPTPSEQTTNIYFLPFEGATILTKKLTVIMDYTYIHQIASSWSACISANTNFFVWDPIQLTILSLCSRRYHLLCLGYPLFVLHALLRHDASPHPYEGSHPCPLASFPPTLSPCPNSTI